MLPSSQEEDAQSRMSVNNHSYWLAAASVLFLLAGCQSQPTEPPELIGKPASAASSTMATQRYQAAWSPVEHSSQYSEYSDIWARVRNGFQMSQTAGRTVKARIDKQRRRFTKSPTHIETSTKRSAPYIHYIVEQLEQENMPLELALLPLIESSYNPFAKSPARAVGLWQFIPSTGLHFNLRQTRLYDGRRDITASTKAAIKYLKYLHNLFDDWPLALAAYNYGQGNVGKAIARNRKRGLPTDYWSLRLPKETAEYVPKLLALAEVFKRPELYGINLPAIADKPYFHAVAIRDRVSLNQVARIANVDPDELHRLNPAFTRKITTLDGPRHLLVPVEKADRLTASGLVGDHRVTLLAQGSGSTSSSSSRSRKVSSSGRQSVIYYQVRKGDSLYQIAQRFNVGLQTLQRWNPQQKKQTLQPGQMLTVYLQ